METSVSLWGHEHIWQILNNYNIENSACEGRIFNKYNGNYNDILDIREEHAYI